jgi:hypothetical protein
MNIITPATIAMILALGIAGAATVAPAAARLQPVLQADGFMMNQAAALQIDASLPAITIVGKRLSAADKARSAG